ncbi:MAG TPA: hypothetical protein VIZ17_10555 [Acetobacteraceae bacterium]
MPPLQYIVEGGHRLTGTIEPSGNKNAALPIIAAALPICAADLDPELCARIRASILLAGPLLARCGEVTLPPPGGDVIGWRRLDTHFLAFEQLGATVTATDRLEFRASRLKGADVFLDEPSVTATENALVAAVAARGTSDERLNALGARIRRVPERTPHA